MASTKPGIVPPPGDGHHSGWVRAAAAAPPHGQGYGFCPAPRRGGGATSTASAPVADGGERGGYSTGRISHSFGRRAGGGRRRGTTVGCLFALGVLAWVWVMGSFGAFFSARTPSSSAAAPLREPVAINNKINTTTTDSNPASSAPRRTTSGLPAVHAPGLDTPAAANGGGDRAAVPLATRNGADANSIPAGGGRDYLHKPRSEIESDAVDVAGPYAQFPGPPAAGREEGVRNGGG
ncbi:unnamed protein product, partial [Ectocarpus sp. 13 AM-2016]